MTVRVGIVGLGRWAVAHHIPAIAAHPQAQLTAFVEPDSVRRRAGAERFGVPAFADAQALLEADIADVLVVASPPAFHFDVAAAALRARRHVLIEKPMTIDPLEAWELVELERTMGAAIVVGYPFLFSPTTAVARDMVADEELGPLRMVAGVCATPSRWLYAPQAPLAGADPFSAPRGETFADPGVAGGGQAATQVTHALASLLHATARQVAAVTAQMRNADLDVDVADGLLLELDDGAVATLASIGVLPPSEWFHLELRYYGDCGCLVHDVAAGALRSVSTRGATRELPPVPREERNPTHAPVHCLVDWALGERYRPASTALAAHAVEIVAAAYRSAGEGGRRVEIGSRVAARGSSVLA